MIMKTGVEITHNGQETSSSLYDIIWKAFASNVGICFANLDHRKTLFSLNDEIRKKQGTEIVQQQARSIPTINWAFIGFFAGVSISDLLLTSKNIVKPVCQSPISACDNQFAMPLRAVSITSLFHLSKVKTSFSIDYACYIGKLFWGLILGKWNKLSHRISFVNDHTIINDREIKYHRERLSERAAKADAIV